MIVTTVEAARELGTSSARLTKLIAKRRIPAPAKNASGAYVWTRADIDRTARLLPTFKSGRPPARNGLPTSDDFDMDRFLRAGRDRARQLKHEDWANWFQLMLDNKDRFESGGKSEKQHKQMVGVT
jgi:hypothetical protein